MKEFSTTIDHSWLELWARAQDVFGKRLTVVILTGDRQPTLTSFANPAAYHVADQAVLSAALEIAETLLDLEAKPTIQAWFVGKNAMLDDRAPALVMRTDPDAVREAARQFAAYG